MRCFVAIELTAEIREALLEAGRFVRGYDATWADEKWVSADLMHVTLKFCGNVGEDDLHAVSAALAAVAASVPPFELRLSGLSAKPSGRRCRMIWAAFDDPSGRCSALASAVDDALEPLGLERDDRAFTAHATLCRSRREKRLDASCLSCQATSDDLLGRSMSVPSFSLVSSRLGRGEPEYATLDSWLLSGQ